MGRDPKIIRKVGEDGEIKYFDQENREIDSYSESLDNEMALYFSKMEGLSKVIIDNVERSEYPYIAELVTRDQRQK